MMLKFIKDKPHNEFWKWFADHSEDYFNIEDNPDLLIRELNTQLKKINTDLTFEFGPIVDNKREFIISADGIKSSFPDVIKLVQNAPIFDKWKIIAFRPRIGTDVIVEFGDDKLTADDVFFTYSVNADNKIDLILYLENREERSEIIENGIFILLDSALGEYDVETKLGNIEIKPLSKGEMDHLMHFRELPAVVDKKCR